LPGRARPAADPDQPYRPTHNLQKDPKCSLLVGEREADDVQAVGRLTYLAEAQKLEPAAIEAAAERYYRYFPDSQNYHKAHDFDFWVLKPVRHRYIGGFGAIHWVDQLTWPTRSPARPKSAWSST
jgi:putative heme iron utilization protein